MDRPYLNSQNPGIDSNVFSTVKDYSSHFDGELRPKEEIFAESMNILLNEKWPINNSNFHNVIPKASNIIDLEEEIAQRPVTDHFHPEKGYKFDVRVALEDRYPHVADRLGHPEIFPTPIETLLRIERALCHPGYLDQPFIKIPSAEPNAEVDFTSGEILYENPKAGEWGRFFAANYVLALAYLAAWNPYLSFGASSTPSFRVRDEVYWPYFDQSWYNWDSYQLFPVVYCIVATFYLGSGLVY
jgi:hypothetical protein